MLDISKHFATNRIEKFVLALELQHFISLGVCGNSDKGTNFKSSFLKMAFLHLARSLTV